MKIGLLGGTFDPIHGGHLAIAQAAQKQFGLKRIYFIPAYHSPYKKRTFPQASARHRLWMARLALTGLKHWHVSDWEIRRKGLSYTVNTVRYFSKRFPRAQRYLILGADAYRTFPRWKNPEMIRRYVALLAAPRGSSLKLWKTSDQKIRMKLSPVSSTQIRKELQARDLRSLTRHLPKKVMSYIQRHGLYGLPDPRSPA